MSEVEAASSNHGNRNVVVGDLLLYPGQSLNTNQIVIDASMAKVMSDARGMQFLSKNMEYYKNVV